MTFTAFPIPSCLPNPSDYSKNASFVYSAKYTNAVLGLLDAQPGERIIDLGCGTAELTRQIKEAVGSDGFVAGVDSSEEMVRPVLTRSELMVACQS
jgi:ubiquinone/menaquinone biosynthesis C-methylase UbiE